MTRFNESLGITNAVIWTISLHLSSYIWGFITQLFNPCTFFVQLHFIAFSSTAFSEDFPKVRVEKEMRKHAGASVFLSHGAGGG